MDWKSPTHRSRRRLQSALIGGPNAAASTSKGCNPKDGLHPLSFLLALVRSELRGVGDFDLVLLGLGEGGHTSSLFPNHDWGVKADAADVLAVFDAPKPPAQRLSLSATRLSRARAVLFLGLRCRPRRPALLLGNLLEKLSENARQPSSDAKKIPHQSRREHAEQAAGKKSCR